MADGDQEIAMGDVQFVWEKMTSRLQDGSIRVETNGLSFRAATQHGQRSNNKQSNIKAHKSLELVHKVHKGKTSQQWNRPKLPIIYIRASPT